MNQAQFEQINKDAGRSQTLENYIQTSAEQEQLGNPPPDGGEWTSAGVGLGIRVTRVKPKVRIAYRNFCEWEEVTLLDGSTGIYVHAHAGAASRF